MNVPSVEADYTRVAIDFKVKSRREWIYSVLYLDYVRISKNSLHCKSYLYFL